MCVIDTAGPLVQILVQLTTAIEVGSTLGEELDWACDVVATMMVTHR